MSAENLAIELAGGARRWAGHALDLLYPRNCQCCGRPLTAAERGVVCADCLAGVKWIEPPFCERCALPFAGTVSGAFACGHCQGLVLHFRRAVAACRAQGIVRDCIHRFKYDRQMYFGSHLAEWLVTAGRRWVDWREVDVLVPVPLHPRKQRERQFNQAEWLAAAAGKAFGKPVLRRNLRRVKDTRTQTALDARARRANLREAFRVRNAEDVAGKRVALVDDVFTTGATLDACAKVLRGTGARDIIVLTVARGV
jgi:competence protein ComFC